MASTRERKIEFIKNFGWGTTAMDVAVGKCLFKYGTDWLTDEQLEDMCLAHIEDWKFSEKINRENRRRRKAEVAA